MKTQFKRGFSWRDETGYYPTPTGGKYPSVTTVLGPHDDFLWVHLKKISSLVDVLSEKLTTGETHEVWRQIEESYELVSENPKVLLRDGKFISNEGFRFLKECSDRGTVLHELVVDYATGAFGDVEQVPERLEELIYEKHASCKIDDVVPFGVQLWSWLSAHSPRILWAEAPVYNDTYGYAGTCDGIMLLNNSLLCFDLKTQSSYSAKRTHFAQIAAYSQSEYILHEDGTSEPFPVPGMPCGVLYCTPEQCGIRFVENAELYFTELFLPSLKSFNAAKALAMPKKQALWYAKKG